MENTNIYRNKGEWSEVHVKLSLLSKNTINITDIKNNTVQTYFLERLLFDNKFYITIGQSIYLKETNPETGESYNTFLMYVSEIKDKLKKIEEKIKKGKGAFQIEEASYLMNKLRFTNKDFTNKKSDMTALLKTSNHTSITKEISIKAFTGSNPTIFNASVQSTRLKFNLNIKNEYQNLLVSELAQNNLGARKNIKELEKINVSLGNVQFSDSLKHNLSILKAKKAVVACVKHHFTKKDKTMSFVKEMKNIENDYESSIKSFLSACVTDMNPSVKMENREEKLELVILINPDFSYEILSGDEQMQEYLYKCCYIDTPSQTRHNYGFIYEDDGKWCIDLNFQIRIENKSH